MAKKAFETYGVQLQMRGQAVNTVHLNKITAPEFLILQQVHGTGSAKMLAKQGDDVERRINETGVWLQRVRPPEALIEYLINKYNKNVFESVFPGANPVLPFTYEDAGLIKDESVSDSGFGDGWETVGVALEETAPVKGKPMTAVAKDIDLIGTSTKKA